MPAIHEVATLTSKGQITLPKSIWQALDADTGSKLAFELRGDEVVTTRADAELSMKTWKTALARLISGGVLWRGPAGSA
ncbi:AbrB/MazE/SpoVT family DNA-binding domain-containing protein [Castellaniella caeni]|uniref:AbrB/MazE/SpoVT family DNA-binding domain-containing protein n=1 Tax=Castellaniella caeni TaxID=266123 RepID=UPI000AF32454